MFGTLRRLASKAVAALRPYTPAPVKRKAIPLIRGSASLLSVRMATAAEHHPHSYPFRACRTKIKGRKDRSLKSRANRRKAGRKARAR